MKGYRLNLEGQRFDKLLVVAKAESTASGTRWLCRCDCGNEITKLSTQLTRLKADSHTGCRACERFSRSDSMTEHGGAKFGKTRLYRIWKMIRVRCTYPRAINFKYYGGKGVRRCAEWDSFAAFREWALANGYNDSLTIDRIDSNGHYEPANCEWVTPGENSRRAIAGRKRAA